jgi:hypothetical protein
LSAVYPLRTPFDVRFAAVDVHRTDSSRRPGTAIIVSGVEDAGRTVRSAPAHCSSGTGRAVHDVGLGTATAPCVIASIASCARGDCFMISRTSATGTRRSRPAYPKAMSPRVRRCPSCRTLSPRRMAASYGWRSCRHTFRATPDPGVMRLFPAKGLRQAPQLPQTTIRRNRNGTDRCNRTATVRGAVARKCPHSACAIVRSPAQALCLHLRSFARTFPLCVCIGAPGFEPGTSPTRTVRATRLRHAPMCGDYLMPGRRPPGSTGRRGP